MTINVFIDTNIYLSLYDFSDNGLSELEKVLEYIIKKKLKIYITQQIINEFWRNRESRIKEGLAEFKKFSAKNSFSNLEKNHEKFAELKKSLKGFIDIHNDILKDVENKAQNLELPVDILIKKLFES
jgi:rRNA-processing protein FCF1